MGPQSELAVRLREQAGVLAGQITERHLLFYPTLVERFASRAQVRCREDSIFHLDHLAAAIDVGEDQLFADYVSWTASMLAARGIEQQDLARHLQVTAEVVGEELGSEAGDRVSALVAASLKALEVPAGEPVSYLDDSAAHGRLARSFMDALLSGQQHRATSLIVDAAESGVEVESLYLEVFEPCLREIGRLWQLGQVSVAEEHFVTGSIQLAMAQLYPRIFRSQRIGRTVVVACVGAELHAVGGRMVADFFELKGWDSRFLGADVPSDAVAQMAADLPADVVAISVTGATHLAETRRLVERVREKSSARVLVGGRILSTVPNLWRSLGADGTAGDARGAVDTATKLVAG